MTENPAKKIKPKKIPTKVIKRSKDNEQNRNSNKSSEKK